MATKRTKATLEQLFASGAIPTGAQFEDLIHSYVDDLPPRTIEVVSGAITRTQLRHRVDTENQTATDDLTTINGMLDGEEIILSCADPSRPATLKSTDNIDLASDFTLDAWRKNIRLWYNASQGKLNEISRNV